MLAAAVIVAVVGFLLKLISAESGGGWFLVPLAGAAAIFHIYVHASAARNPETPGRIAVASDIFFGSAILLQIDFGGGRCGWDTLTGVAWRLGMSNDMGCVPLNGMLAILLDVAFYIPVALTWWKLRASRSQ